MIKKIKKWFKKKQPPNLKDGWLHMADLVAAFDNTQFYLTQIPGYRPAPDQLKYLANASFALCSARDELRLSYEKDLVNKHKERLLNERAIL